MKKYLLLILGIALFTGCDAEYNLNIDSSIVEETSIIETNSANWDANYGDGSFKDIIKYRIKYPLPLLDSNREYGQYEYTVDNKKIDGVPYYDVFDLSDSSQIGLMLKGEFNDNYNESIVAIDSLQNFYFEEEDRIEINAAGFKMFDSYDTLDRVKVNIKTDYKVLDNNADSVDGNTYTWNVNRTNYNDKTVFISIDKPVYEKIKNNIEKKSNKVSNSLLIGFILLLFIVIIFVCMMLIKRKRKDAF